MSKSKKLVFFGTEDFSASSLRKLVASGYDIAAIVTKPDSPSGRGQKVRSPAVSHIAKVAGIKVLQPENLAGIKPKLAKLKADLGVLVAYGKIIPQNIIDLFPLGIINVHPSLLPRYRGPSPIETAVLNGDKKTGVSLMKLTAGMDEGPVYIQKPVAVIPGASRIIQSGYLAEAGAELLQENLPAIISGSLRPLPQNDSQASYTKLLKKEDGVVDFNEPAEKIERKVRAYFGFPKTRANLHGVDVIITKARVAKSQDDGDLVIPCEVGHLEIEELIAPSGRTMSGADFRRGYYRPSRS